MKGNTSNKVRENAPLNLFKESNMTFVIEEKMLWFFFTVPIFFIYIFLLAAQMLLKIKVSVERLFSECGGAYERLLWYGWAWGWEGNNHSILTTEN